MTSNIVNPAHQLILKEDVEIALRADVGDQAKLTSFKVVEFTSKGDNYASFVTSVEVNFTVDGKRQETSYVVKSNPCQTSGQDASQAILFSREHQVYTSLVPQMNDILKTLGEKRVTIPACYHSKLEEGSEILFLEDMRRKNFIMSRNEAGLDEAHVSLVLKELGRFHGSSTLLRKKLQLKSLKDSFHCLNALFSRDAYPQIYKTYNEFVSSSAKIGYEIAKMVGGFRKVEKFLCEKSTDTMEYMFQLTEKNNKVRPQFLVACHGDCWMNNILFKYDGNGNPEDVCFIDLQITNENSGAYDLNYFLFTSVGSHVRQPNLKDLLRQYYDSFSSVTKSANQPVDFTFEELLEEFRNQNYVGLLMAMLVVPLVLSKDVKSLDVQNMDESNAEAMMKDHQVNVLIAMKKHPQFKARVLDTFAEMEENENLFTI